jgi:prepilin-type N-terminal cleavage/methylation domain-containing protein
MTRARRRPGFTLIELLVVIAIIGLLASMIAFLPASERRRGDVRAAAEELAATLRSARSMAMRQQAVCGVAFNIRNGLGTSGRVLNNRDGGHWYRIIGPSENGSGYPHPSFTGNGGGKYVGDTKTVAGFLGEIEAAWAGDRHILPPRRVRFLALTDQDNGTRVIPTVPSYMMYPFPATYPRPWFGSWDPASKRLYPWGGYDTALLDNRGLHCSGFYYEGADANGGKGIVGCANPSDRFTTWEGPGNGRQLLAAGQGRPLINAAWLDYVIVFTPDGRVKEGPIMETRHASCRANGAAGSSATGGTGSGDLGDFAGGFTSVQNWHALMSSYAPHTGVYAITLCPDIDKDTDIFPTAAEAFRSIWPMYRVTVNRFGYVRVEAVSQLPPAGAAFDTTTITNWQNKGQIQQYYRYLYATDAKGDLRGKPVTGFLTPEVLASRQWWMTAP